MPSHIALRGLPIENLKRKPFRTGALLAVVTILALTFFGGTMLTMNLNTGMTSMEKRLGADLMVVPQNTVQKAEALLTNGNPSTFYFTKDIADEVMQADGIAQATEQTYISSLAAACCAEKLQIIGYDPDTDFVIEPWVASQFEGPLEDGQMIAGANVNVSTDGTIELYGRSWPVVAQLANTGTSLDNSVFINQNTVPDMVAASAKVSKQVMSAEYAGKAVSTVMIKTQQGYEAQTVAENIKRLDSRFADLGYVYPRRHHRQHQNFVDRACHLPQDFRGGDLGNGRDCAARRIRLVGERTQTRIRVPAHHGRHARHVECHHSEGIRHHRSDRWRNRRRRGQPGDFPIQFADRQTASIAVSASQPGCGDRIHCRDHCVLYGHRHHRFAGHHVASRPARSLPDPARGGVI